MVTIKDIAKATGVSVGTISKVMTGSDELRRISPSTINRIRKLAREMGYRPNVNARALVRQKSQTIGVYVAPHPGQRIDSLYVSPILEGICEAARDAHHDVMLIDFGSTDNELNRSLEKFLTKRVDGVILIHYQGTGKELQPAIAAGMPMITVDNFNMQPLSCVNLDNAGAISMVVQYLFDLGHRKIAFLGELNEMFVVDHMVRKEAFIAAIRRLQIEQSCTVVGYPEIDYVVPREGPFCQEDGFRGVDWLIAHKKEFTAVACYNDLVAMGALRRLTQAGLKVPDDVSLIGFDDNFVSAYLAPALTTVSHPTRAMGVQAVQILLEEINKGTNGNPTKMIMLKPELVIRESCRQITT